MGVATTRRATVLVVDDEVMIRNIIRFVLRRRGYDVVEASDGEAGLQSLALRDDIDLVLSDVVMPGIDGVRMAQTIREQRPTLPVLFMSGYMGHERPDMDAEDVEWLLRKPFTPRQLVERVEQILDRSLA